MNGNVIFDTIVNASQKDQYSRVDVLRRELSEQEEALIRSQAMLMLDRNVGKQHVHKRVLKRFRRCIG